MTSSYQHIVDTVTKRIASGDYRPGSRLPSESRFCAEFGVSPMTLRRALTILVDRGLIWTERGRGTFVRPLGLGDSVFRLASIFHQAPQTTRSGRQHD